MYACVRACVCGRHVPSIHRLHLTDGGFLRCETNIQSYTEIPDSSNNTDNIRDMCRDSMLGQ